MLLSDRRFLVSGVGVQIGCGSGQPSVKKGDPSSPDDLMSSSGSLARPFLYRVRWRWQDVDRPVGPTVPKRLPLSTFWPTLTSILLVEVGGLDIVAVDVAVVVDADVSAGAAVVAGPINLGRSAGLGGPDRLATWRISRVLIRARRLQSRPPRPPKAWARATSRPRIRTGLGSASTGCVPDDLRQSRRILVRILTDPTRRTQEHRPAWS